MTIEEWKNTASALQSIATVLSFAIGGWWVYWRYIRQQERYPNIEFSTDINFIGVQGGWWIVELIALIDNKGKAQHRMSEFRFDLNALYSEESVETNEKWGGQVDFVHPIAEGSFLPQQYEFFFVDPGTKAKYSYVTRVPTNATFVILHSRFQYVDSRRFGHTAERTAQVPREGELPSLSVQTDHVKSEAIANGS